MAATANGTLTSPAASEPQPTTTAPTDTSALKRKRDDEQDGVVDHGHNEAQSRSRQTQQDILDLLQQHDTTPSFLKHEVNSQSDVSAPSQKKARWSDPTTKTTISDKLAGDSYSSLALLRDDAACVSNDIESALRAKAKDGEIRDGGRLPVEDLKQIQRAKAFEELVEDVVDKESHYDAVHQDDAVKKEATSMVNGHVPTAQNGGNGRAGSVLTLFGNAPTPKQLFSSMQTPPIGKQDPMIKSELPVEEMSLPNGLTATKIVPAPTGESKKGATFEDAFAPPCNLPALHPPKAHKRSSTRDTTVTWEFKDPITRGSKKGGYTVQGLPTGEWLGYGGLDASQESASAKEKRKQRDRALSSGAEAIKEPHTKTSLAEQQAREEEALFRRAYSSFAPSHDNAKSIIPAETKSTLGWHKVGEQRFQETFAIDHPALLDEQSGAIITPLTVVENASVNDAALEKIMENLDDLDEDMADITPLTAKTDIEQVLREISQLLETLASHQRIRNATLSSATAASRMPISPAPVLAAKIGKPDEPAEDEVSTYQALRRELCYLIMKLPPYAVAKLDGDQLAELGVSKLIPIQGKDIKGIMEEDQVARLAKHNAMATAAGIASLTRSTSATSGQHYSTTAQRTPAIGQAANTRYGSSSQFSASRTPATQPRYQRSTSNQSTYGTPSATAPRPGYGQQPNQYTRPSAPQQSSYTLPNGQQYYQQRPPTQQTPSGYYGTSQQYSQTPSAQPRPAYNPSQPLQQFQQRSAAANGAAYQTNASTQGQTRTASPANVQPRPPLYAQQSASGRATPTFASQPQTPVNGFARPQPNALP